MDTAIQICTLIVAIIGIVTTVGLIIARVLGNKKWEKIFQALALGNDAAKKLIPKDANGSDKEGEPHWPHTKAVDAAAKAYGVKPDVDRLLKKHGMNRKEN